MRGEDFASLFLRSKNPNAYLYAMLVRGEDFASLFLLRIYCNRIYVFYPVTDVTFYSFLIFVYLHIEIYA